MKRKSVFEENYLASVSDIMSGLVFIFIITLMVFSLRLKGSQKNQETEIKKLKEKQRILELEKKQLRKDKNELLKVLLMLTGAQGLRENLLEKMQNKLQEKGFQVKIDTEQGILRLPDEILFPSGSDKLRPSGKKMLSYLSEALAENLPGCTFNASGTNLLANTNLPKGLTPSFVEAIFIEGHTDNIPIGKGSKFRNNWDLSTARSYVTYQTMQKMVPKLNSFFNQDRQPIFSVSGYAANRPVASNNSKEGRAQNRRIDLRIIMSSPKAKEGVIEKLQKEIREEK